MRVFFLNKKVVKNRHVVMLLNEYGQQPGSLTPSLLYKNSGEIKIEGVSYISRLDSAMQKINLFEDYHYQPVLTCNIEMKEWPFSDNIYINFILFSLAWFVYLAKEKKSSSQLA